jgi:hypothetical protein
VTRPEPRFPPKIQRTPERAVESAHFWIWRAREYIEWGKLDLAINRMHHCLDMLLMALVPWERR